MSEKEYVIKYRNVKELISTINEKVMMLRSELGELLKLMDDLSDRLEKLKLVYDKFGIKPEETVIEREGVKIIFGESLEAEHEVLSQIANEVQNRIDMLRKIAEFFKTMEDIDIPVVVYWSQGIPKAITFRAVS